VRSVSPRETQRGNVTRFAVERERARAVVGTRLIGTTGGELDAKSFIRTGAGVAPATRWTAARQRVLLETSRTGVFAAGDVRSGSVKRVASAVGEGAMAIMFVHEYLKTV
jgi:thioredoxin reductase